MKFEDLTDLLSQLSICIPLILIFLQWNRLPSAWSAIRWIGVVSFLGDVLGYATAVFFRNSTVVGNLYLLIQFSLLFSIFNNFNLNKRLLLVVYVIYICYYIVNIFLFEDLFRFLTNANALGGFLVILLILYFFYKQLVYSSVPNLPRLPITWIAFAFLLYYSVSFFIFLAHNYLADQVSNTMWIIHNFANFSKNAIIAIALWMNYRILRA